MIGEILNPVRWEDIESDMTEAEKQFAECLALGKLCVLGDAVPQDQESGTHNTIRGEVIRFFAYGGDVNHPVRGANILLQGAWIPPQPFLDLMFARIPYSLGMRKCNLGSDILMIGAQFVGLSLDGSHFCGNLYGDGAKIDGNLLFRDGFVAEGEIRLIGAHIGGLMDCENGKFINPGKMAIVADNIRIDGDAQFRDGFSAKGEVRISAARIGGELDCSNGTFDNSKNCALHAEGVHVQSRIVMRGISVTGATRLIGAYTNGELDCGGGCFDGGEGGASLLADRVTAGRGIILHDGFVAIGEVRLTDARTDGNLDCSSGIFRNSPGQDALSANFARVGGTVSLSGEFSAIGEVRFSRARIGVLECNGDFENPGKIALDASDMEVRVEVALRAQFQGEVRLVGTYIGRALDVTGTLDNPGGMAFNAERVEAREGVLWLPKGGEGKVIFDFAKTGTLADRIEAWRWFDKISLNGFTYGQFVNPADAQSRLRWLSKRPDKIPFSTQPYEQAAKALRAAGKDIDAWDIEREKRELQRTEPYPSSPFQISGWGRLWGRAIDALMGFVYRPWKTLGWAIVIVCTSALLFNFADKHGWMVPHQPIVLENMDYRAEAFSRCVEFQCPPERRPTTVVRRLFSDYPEFSPLAFSLDVFIPFFALHQELFWAPASGDSDTLEMLLFLLLLGIVTFFTWLFRHWRRVQESGVPAAAVGMAVVSLEIAVVSATGVAHILYGAESVLWLVGWRWLTVWYWFEIVAGWILTSLFLLSVTGLLRPRQSSGERE